MRVDQSRCGVGLRSNWGQSDRRSMQARSGVNLEPIWCRAHLNPNTPLCRSPVEKTAPDTSNPDFARADLADLGLSFLDFGRHRLALAEVGHMMSNSVNILSKSGKHGPILADSGSRLGRTHSNLGRTRQVYWVPVQIRYLVEVGPT